ncbi:MAG TPA: glycosyltransferase 87 family protein [Blastocatellia bacterium]|nr:glycosyltransferase 87 family protein [Blastocatellia bacterium]
MRSISSTFDIRLAQSGDAGRFYRRLALLLLGIVVLAAMAGVVIPAGIGWDFANFYDTGRRAAAGQIADLYHADSLIAGAQPQGKLAFWGAPISAFFYVPLSLFSAEWALIVFKLQNVVALFAALWLLYQDNRRFAKASPVEQWKFAALFAGLVLIYQPFWSIFRVGGQTTPTVFLLFTIALLNHTKEKFNISAACLVLALLIKPGFVFVLLPLCLVSGLRFLRSLAFASMAVGLVSVLLLGWDIHAEFLQVMLSGMKNAYPWMYNSSLYVTAENLRLLAVPPVDIRLLAVPVMLVKLAMVLLFGGLYWLSRKEIWSRLAQRHFDFLMAITFCLMFSQTVWEHYLAVLFIPLVYLVAAVRQHNSRVVILLAAIFALSLFQNILLVNVIHSRVNFSSIPELVVVGLVKSSPLLLTLVFLIRHREEFFASYLGPQWKYVAVKK